jgi:hypothetical protein
MRTLLALVLWTGVAMAQNSFPTPGGARVPGAVVMCITAGKAVPCSGTVTAGPDGSFKAPGGQTVGGKVRMCVTGGVATPC